MITITSMNNSNNDLSAALVDSTNKSCHPTPTFKRTSKVTFLPSSTPSRKAAPTLSISKPIITNASPHAVPFPSSDPLTLPSTTPSVSCGSLTVEAKETRRTGLLSLLRTTAATGVAASGTAGGPVRSRVRITAPTNPRSRRAHPTSLHRRRTSSPPPPSPSTNDSASLSEKDTASSEVVRTEPALPRGRPPRRKHTADLYLAARLQTAVAYRLRVSSGAETGADSVTRRNDLAEHDACLAARLWDELLAAGFHPRELLPRMPVSSPTPPISSAATSSSDDGEVSEKQEGASDEADTTASVHPLDLCTTPQLVAALTLRHRDVASHRPRRRSNGSNPPLTIKPRSPLAQGAMVICVD